MLGTTQKIHVGPIALACMLALASNNAGLASSNKAVDDFLSGKSNSLTGVDSSPGWSKMIDDGPVVHSFRLAPSNDPGFAIPVGPEFPGVVPMIEFRSPDRFLEKNGSRQRLDQQEVVMPRRLTPSVRGGASKTYGLKPLPQYGNGPSERDRIRVDQPILDGETTLKSRQIKTESESKSHGQSDTPVRQLLDPKEKP